MERHGAAVSASTFPLFGQAWRLVITSATATGYQQTTVGSEDWTTESLRVTFDVLQAMNTSPIWYADISIYNLDDALRQDLILNATWATLSAGFQNKTSPAYLGVIWDGPVFQTIFTQEQVVDKKLTLHCVAIPGQLDNIVSFSMGQFSSQQQLVARMSDASGLPPISVGNGNQGAIAAQRMQSVMYPRGNTVFGKVSKYMSLLADSNQLQTWNDGKQAYISEVQNDNTAPSLIYAPPFPLGYVPQAQDQPPGTTNSIIGTPEQIQQGVIFTVLLDPRIKVTLPPLVIQLVRTQITQLVRTPSVNSELPTPLSSNLTFFAGQVRHSGDTRGNLWQTEVTGWSTAYAQTLLNLFT
jgi:hypothetical protein